MSITSAAGLLDALRKYRILDAVQLAKLTRSLKGRSPEPRIVAKELLKHDWVTPYQVNLLLQGRGAELLLGEYLLQQRLGEGGMGQVFKACHLLMKRTVAIKIIRKEHLTYSDAIERFQREIRVAAQLDHPHLVRALDAARVGDTHFLVMEYVEGADLQRLVQKSGPLPLGQACTYISQAALGLQQAAERGLVHRDIKPSNLQVTADGKVVKILDLGLARLQTADGTPERAGGLTQAYAVLGTPDYIAPEQIADPRHVDIRADIYSLGCTFYYLLAGRPPFPEGAWEEKLVCHRKVEPHPIEQIRPDVPPAVGTILRKMMAKRPEDRYTASVNVAQALTPFCQLAGAVLPSPSTAPASPFAQSTRGYQQEGTLPTTSPLAPVLPSAEPTMLVNTQQPATPAAQRPRSRKRFPLVLAGAGAGLVLLILVLALAWPKDKKDDNSEAQGTDQPGAQSKSAGPRFLIDEDFRTAVANGWLLPKEWEGDAFRVAKDHDDCFLESSKLNDIHRVKTKLSGDLSGNFVISGRYVLDHGHLLGFEMENRPRGSHLVVGFDWDGKTSINTDIQQAPAGFICYKLTEFRVEREGKMLRVHLDNKPTAQKTLDEALAFDALYLRMKAGNGGVLRLPARLYGLKVVTTGSEAIPAPMQPPTESRKGKKKG